MRTVKGGEFVVHALMGISRRRTLTFAYRLAQRILPFFGQNSWEIPISYLPGEHGVVIDEDRNPWIASYFKGLKLEWLNTAVSFVIWLKGSRNAKMWCRKDCVKEWKE